MVLTVENRITLFGVEEARFQDDSSHSFICQLQLISTSYDELNFGT